MKPILAISLGDPAGIGPEIVAASLDAAVLISYPVIFGHWPSFEWALNKIDNHPIVTKSAQAIKPKDGTVVFVPTGPNVSHILKSSNDASVAQLSALSAAVDSVLLKKCDAIVTAPVSKEAISNILSGFIGHTEYLAQRCNLNNDEVTMIFASDTLTIGLLATHVAAKDIYKTINYNFLNRTLQHVIQVVKGLNYNLKPNIGIAALNPHAGENGLLGTEEIEIMQPFIRETSLQKVANIYGPIPADTIYRDAFAKKYDAVVAAYHDQAMIPLKLAGVGATVNITAGLPFIRTSPDHGVAYDIAKKHLADPAGMKQAIVIAAKLWANFTK